MKPLPKQAKKDISVPNRIKARFFQIINPLGGYFSSIVIALVVRELGTPEEQKVAQAKIDSIRAEVGL